MKKECMENVVKINVFFSKRMFLECSLMLMDGCNHKERL